MSKTQTSDNGTHSMMNPDGNRIREMRERRVWFQEQLAEIADLNVRTIQRVEAGHGASFETLKALASAFETDVDALLVRLETPSAKAPQREKCDFILRVTTGAAL